MKRIASLFLVAALPFGVTDTTTAEYYAGKDNIAPRPLNSIMDLTKLQATGFTSHDWHEDLKDYITKETAQ